MLLTLFLVTLKESKILVQSTLQLLSKTNRHNVKFVFFTSLTFAFGLLSDPSPNLAFPCQSSVSGLVELSGVAKND